MNGAELKGLRLAMQWTPEMMAREIGIERCDLADLERCNHELSRDIEARVRRGYRRWLDILLGPELLRAKPEMFECAHDYAVYNSAREEQQFIYRLRRSRRCT